MSTETTGLEPTSLYRYYDARGILIYIGITKQGIGRNRQHNRRAEWWRFVARQEVEHFPSRQQAQESERRLIRQLMPPFNQQHNPQYAELRAAYLHLPPPVAESTAAAVVDRLRERAWLVPLMVHSVEEGEATFLIPMEFEDFTPNLSVKPKAKLLAAGNQVLGRVNAVSTQRAVTAIKATFKKGLVHERPGGAEVRLRVVDQRKPVRLAVEYVRFTDW